MLVWGSVRQDMGQAAVCWCHGTDKAMRGRRHVCRSALVIASNGWDARTSSGRRALAQEASLVAGSSGNSCLDHAVEAGNVEA